MFLYLILLFIFSGFFYYDEIVVFGLMVVFCVWVGVLIIKVLVIISVIIVIYNVGFNWWVNVVEIVDNIGLINCLMV